MKIRYDKKVDAAYIQMSSKKPDGAVEIAEGVSCTQHPGMRSSRSRYLMRPKFRSRRSINLRSRPQPHEL